MTNRSSRTPEAARVAATLSVVSPGRIAMTASPRTNMNTARYGAAPALSAACPPEWVPVEWPRRNDQNQKADAGGDTEHRPPHAWEPRAAGTATLWCRHVGHAPMVAVLARARHESLGLSVLGHSPVLGEGGCLGFEKHRRRFSDRRSLA